MTINAKMPKNSPRTSQPPANRALLLAIAQQAAAQPIHKNNKISIAPPKR
jgi:hypothetical protein